MKVLIDIGHPAHVHFFKNPALQLQQLGHEVIITSRDKDVALPLLDDLGLNHIPLSAIGAGGIVSLGKELIYRNYALYKVVRREKPDVMIAIGGTFIAHVGVLTGTPSLVFYDTENAKLQNLITYPLATKVIVPRCYKGWTPGHKAIRYPGYHELSYLHPDHFKVNPVIARENGINPNQENFLLRIVSWQANHDIGQNYWSVQQLNEMVKWLSTKGTVIISSERELPGELSQYCFKGKVSEIHHVLGMCRLFIGESATMASEAAVMGVPAIYAAETGRGYMDEQEERYDLVKNLKELEWNKLKPLILDCLNQTEENLQSAHKRLLNDTINVADYVVERVLDYAPEAALEPGQ